MLFFCHPCLVADPAPFATQAEVTLRTNYFATRDMLTHFLPLIKAGGSDTRTLWRTLSFPQVVVLSHVRFKHSI